MKITSSKLDDLRKARDEWDAAYEEADAKYQEEHKQYRAAQQAIYEPIESRIKSDLAKFDMLEFDVFVEEYSRYGSSGLEVRVKCNEWRKSDDTTALAWDFSAHLNSEGELVKDSGSWSGLNAVTEDQLNSLLQTYEALKYLNSVDWKTLLNQEMPGWSDYHKTKVPHMNERPNFEKQMKEEEIKEYVGSNKILRGKPLEDSNGYRRKFTVYYLIKSETPKKYKYSTINEYEIQRFASQISSLADVEKVLQNKWTDQTWKENILSSLNYPFEEMTESDLQDILAKA